MAQNGPRSHSGELVVAVSMGATLFLLSAHVLARLTYADPLADLVTSRSGSDAVSAIHMLLVVSVWSRAVPTTRARGAVASGATILALLVATSLAAGWCGQSLNDVLCGYVGHHAWWIALLLLPAALPWSEKSSRTFRQLAPYGLVASASLVSGVCLYAFARHKNALVIFIEVMLILVFPALTLSCVAWRYGGRFQGGFRRVALGVAILAIAVANIR